MLMSRFWLGSLVAALAMLVWAAVYWALVPGMLGAVRPLPAEAAVVIPRLRQHLPTSGVYLYPWPDYEHADREAVDRLLEERHREGPLVQIFFRKQGLSPFSVGNLLLSFMHALAVALLLAWLLKRMGPLLPAWRDRFQFIVLIGAAAALLIDVAQPIWLHQPWTYWLVLAGLDISRAAVAGAVLGYCLRPEVTLVP